MKNILKFRSWYMFFSLMCVLLAFFSIWNYSFKPGIEFTGGSMWQVKFEKEVEIENLRNFLINDLKINEPSVVYQDNIKSYLIRIPEITEDTHKKYDEELKDKFGNYNELSFQTIGSIVGDELKSGALTAFLLVLFVISFYVAIAFRNVQKPNPLIYAFVTLLTLFHDALIPAGVVAYLGHTQNLEVGVWFVVAILVVVGFSVHDTIVVVDRTRENLNKGVKKNFYDTVNLSLYQTFSRSINTSLTLIFTLVSLYVFGPLSLKYFVMVILIGVSFGTYSSIFLASSMLTYFVKKGE